MIFASEEEIKLFLKRTLGTSRRQQLSEEKGMGRDRGGEWGEGGEGGRGTNNRRVFEDGWDGGGGG